MLFTVLSLLVVGVDVIAITGNACFGLVTVGGGAVDDAVAIRVDVIAVIVLLICCLVAVVIVVITIVDYCTAATPAIRVSAEDMCVAVVVAVVVAVAVVIVGVAVVVAVAVAVTVAVTVAVAVTAALMLF